jgi:hypothetical protein
MSGVLYWQDTPADGVEWGIGDVRKEIPAILTGLLGSSAFSARQTLRNKYIRDVELFHSLFIVQVRSDMLSGCSGLAKRENPMGLGLERKKGSRTEVSIINHELEAGRT